MDAKSRIEKEVAKQVSKDIASLIDREFAAKTAPNNKPWAARKKDGVPFDNRDSIRSSIRVESNGSEINITSTKPYTGYLDQGTQHIEACSIFPTGKMPKKWAKTIDDTIEKVLENNIDDLLEMVSK